MNRRPLADRLSEAYKQALDASHNSATVTIHVGRDVWDALHADPSLAHGHADRPDVPGLLSGFPILLEMAWAPPKIQVNTTKVIL